MSRVQHLIAKVVSAKEVVCPSGRKAHVDDELYHPKRSICRRQQPSKAMIDVKKTVSSVKAAVSSFLAYVSPPKPGQDASSPLTVTAVPGLATLLDVALFRSVEGQLTATICSSHALICAWLDLKHQSQILLGDLAADESSAAASSLHMTSSSSQSAAARRLLMESFARHCLDAASDAIERLSVDKLAQSANLSDPYDSGSGTSGSGGHHYNHSNALSGVGSQGVVSGILEGKGETGRRTPSQSRRDCWESPRLLCPDYVWAEECFSTCQRLIRSLSKHPFAQGDMDGLPSVVFSSSNAGSPFSGISPSCERNASLLLQLIQEDLPMRLYHFRAAMDAESVVTKRLYLVKCEYRAPFRAFLEAHQSVQRAPSMALVDEYLTQSNKGQVNQMRDDAKVRLQKLLETPLLIEVLTLEKNCEELEIEMGHMLFPFTELARILDHKRARLKIVPGILEEDEIAAMKECVRRLKNVLCRKGGPPETSQGIRPILLDFQGVPRDDEIPARLIPFAKSFEKHIHGGNTADTDQPDNRDDVAAGGNVEDQLDTWVQQLKTLAKLCKTRNAFKTEKNKFDVDLPTSIVKGCTEFDDELFRSHFLDWVDMVQRQQVAGQESQQLDDLAEEIRRAEMEMSIAVASEQSLEVVRKRLEMIATDRQKRFEVLKEMVEEVCLREMYLHVRLESPDPEQTLELAETSAVGFLGIPLELAGERLPVV